MVVIRGEAAILCPRQASQFRRAWVASGKCTAFLVVANFVSVSARGGGYDEEKYVTTLEGVRIITEEGRATGAKDFFIGGDINIELKLDVGTDEFEGLECIGWYGLYGPACCGGGEDEVTCN